MSLAGILPAVTQFLALIAPALSQPQAAHLARMLDAMIVLEGRKSAARMGRLFRGPRSRSAAADFLTESPWDGPCLFAALRELFFREAVRLASRLPARARRGLRVVARVDDTLVEKPKESTHFAGADWHFDHTRSRSVFGYVWVTLHVSLGPFGFPLGLRLYLRGRTVRRLRRQAPDLGGVLGFPEGRIRFRSKLALARELLVELAPYLEEVKLPVTVLFDSWYCSKSLIRSCRRQRWHVICAIKSNRKLDGAPVRQWLRTLGKSAFSPVEVESAAGESAIYHAASREGRVEGLPSRCRVVWSLRKKRDRNPLYLLSTDVTLSLSEVLQLYAGRWLVELLHWNLKVNLGLKDFRVRSLRGIVRYAAVCMMAQACLEWRAWGKPGTSPVDVRNSLRALRAERLLRASARAARRGVNIRTIIKTYAPLLAA